MGWSIPWVSSATTNFNFDLGVSYTPEQVRESLTPGQATLPPIVAQNAAATGTDIAGYLSESPAGRGFPPQKRVTYPTYPTPRPGVGRRHGHVPTRRPRANRI